MTMQSAKDDVLYKGLPVGPGLILEGRDGTVYVAVLSADNGIILRHDHNGCQTRHQGPLHGMQVAPDGDIWVSLGDDILRYHARNDATRRTPSSLPRGTTGPLLATQLGDVWCAGCAAMRSGDAHFEAAPPGPAGWTITPSCDDSFGNVWAIAEKGNRRDLVVLNPQQPHT